MGVSSLLKKGTGTSRQSKKQDETGWSLGASPLFQQGVSPSGSLSAAKVASPSTVVFCRFLADSAKIATARTTGVPKRQVFFRQRFMFSFDLGHQNRCQGANG
jgi:hypothetical protein